jgi:hypothetical protein
MSDIAYMALTLAFFAIALWYVQACDRGIGAS